LVLFQNEWVNNLNLHYIYAYGIKDKTRCELLSF